MPDLRSQEPTELIYVPKPSWTPMFVALAVTALVVATFKGWPYALIGAVVLAVALASWIGSTVSDILRLPRRQRVTSAVIPAEPLRRTGRG